MSFVSSPSDAAAIATIRTLAVDVVGKANSGHPGAPMGMAPVAHVLFSRFVNTNPKNSKWFNRDRFVLSNGCVLQYVLLHLLAFRQLDSLTPGHPEAGHTDGEQPLTTGPLGQGFGNGVGLAIAQAHLAAVYNKDGFDLINNFTYVFCGDGCLMEGVASEAASLAGHLQLGNLIVVSPVHYEIIHPHSQFRQIYDDNHISIDGDTAVAFTENVEQRFLSYNWQVLHVDDGDKTTIGFGSKQQGTHGVHGSREPDCNSWAALEAQWNDLFAAYAKQYPTEHAELTRRIAGELPEGWEKNLPLVGGSADLTGSNLTKVKGSVDFQPPSTGLGTYAGTYIRYGVREHGMGAIANGLSAYGAIIPFIATFLNFVSYAAGAVRLSALSSHQVIWVATHDSIGLGEDGPTHQPIETAIHLRAIPNLAFWRPADGNETSAAYYVALKSKKTPSVLSLSRQNLPNLEGSTIEKAAKGGYVVHEVEGEDLTIVSSGSEVAIAIEAASKLKDEGIKVRVVSLPCWLVFDQQSEEYRLSVLRSGAPILSLEALSTAGWQKYSHEQYGLAGWGASGPYQKVYEKFGITGSNITSISKKVVEFYKKRAARLCRLWSRRSFFEAPAVVQQGNQWKLCMHTCRVGQVDYWYKDIRQDGWQFSRPMRIRTNAAIGLVTPHVMNTQEDPLLVTNRK
ncbi:Transketolase [Salix suchowensis]|nr:Transketolase [Salix suchowensis]